MWKLILFSMQSKLIQVFCSFLSYSLYAASFSWITTLLLVYTPASQVNNFSLSFTPGRCQVTPQTSCAAFSCPITSWMSLCKDQLWAGQTCGWIFVWGICSTLAPRLKKQQNNKTFFGAWSSVTLTQDSDLNVLHLSFAISPFMFPHWKCATQHIWRLRLLPSVQVILKMSCGNRLWFIIFALLPLDWLMHPLLYNLLLFSTETT